MVVVVEVVEVVIDQACGAEGMSYVEEGND
jgi:hypothetical protein